VDLYLHSPIRLDGVVLFVKHRNNLTFKTARNVLTKAGYHVQVTGIYWSPVKVKGKRKIVPVRLFF
jgi:hypothetical protein